MVPWRNTWRRQKWSRWRMKYWGLQICQSWVRMRLVWKCNSCRPMMTIFPPHKICQKVKIKGKQFIMSIGDIMAFSSGVLRVQRTTIHVLTSPQALSQFWEVGRVFWWHYWSNWWPTLMYSCNEGTILYHDTYYNIWHLGEKWQWEKTARQRRYGAVQVSRYCLEPLHQTKWCWWSQKSLTITHQHWKDVGHIILAQ